VTSTDPIGEAIREAAQSVQAPLSLRESLAAQGAGTGTRAPRRGVRWLFALGGGVLAAAVLVVVLSLGGGPSVQDVAQAALNRPTAPAPARMGHYVDASIGGIQFPEYEQPWGWKAVGSRRDHVGGRDALTVIYAKGGTGVHYTIVDGAPLDRPDGAKVVDVRGTPVALKRTGDTLIATWERDGHTCILASKAAGEQQLVDLVNWS
jgi:hypothetical protein